MLQLVSTGTGLNYPLLCFILTSKSVRLVEDHCLQLAKGQSVVTGDCLPLLDESQWEAVNIIYHKVKQVC